MNAQAYAPQMIARGYPVPHETGLTDVPPAGVLSRIDSQTGVLREAHARLAKLRERVSSVAASLHGPRPAPPRDRDMQPKAGNPSAMSNMEDAARGLHDEITALDEAVSAL